MKKKNNQPAIFLDRDGVVSVEKGFIASLDDYELFPFTKECIKRLHRMGFLAIVVTNQSAVARGILKEAELIKMNEYLMEQTGADKVYYCPHYFQEGDMEQLPYHICCNCRKPKIGMIEQAQKDFPIDLEHSFMVGDRATDIQMGERAGVTTVLVESGYGTRSMEQEVHPDFIFEDLLAFTNWLSEQKTKEKSEI